MTDPLGDKLTSGYKADSWLTSSVSPKGNVAGCGCQSQYTTTYGHDPFGNLTTVTDPLGHQTIRHGWISSEEYREWLRAFLGSHSLNDEALPER